MVNLPVILKLLPTTTAGVSICSFHVKVRLNFHTRIKIMDDLGHLVQSQIVANLSKSKELSTLLKNKGSRRGFHSITTEEPVLVPQRRTF